MQYHRSAIDSMSTLRQRMLVKRYHRAFCASILQLFVEPKQLFQVSPQEPPSLLTKAQPNSHLNNSSTELTIIVGICSAPSGSALTSSIVASPERTRTPIQLARVAMAISVYKRSPTIAHFEGFNPNSSILCSIIPAFGLPVI